MYSKNTGFLTELPDIIIIVPYYIIMNFFNSLNVVLCLRRLKCLTESTDIKASFSTSPWNCFS